MTKTPPWWFGMALLLMALGVWLVARGASDDGTASTADWVAAISTLGAFLGAAYASWYVARAYDVELKRERDRDDEAKRRQAEQVTAWVENMGKLKFSNPSGLPIWDVTFQFHLRPGQIVVAQPIPLLGPQQEPTDVMINVDTPALEGVMGWFHAANRGEVPDTEWPMVEIRFRDAGGRYWVRHADGTLVADTPGG